MTTPHHNFDLAHTEIAKAYAAYTSADGASGADRIIIVLDLLIHRISDMNGGNSRWGKVKRQGPGVLSGAGIGSIIVSVINALA